MSTTVTVTCDRCKQIIPDPATRVPVSAGGTTSDLCPSCKAKLDDFLAGRAVEALPA